MLPRVLIFLSLQNSSEGFSLPIHLLQPLQSSSCTTGSFIHIFSDSTCVGLKKRCPFDSSTSQSIYAEYLAIAAKLTATRVFPVPPLPLNTAIFIYFFRYRIIY